MISQNTQNQIIYDSSVVPALVAEPAFASGEVGAQHCLPLGVVDLDPRPRAVRLWVVHVPVHPSHTHTQQLDMNIKGTAGQYDWVVPAAIAKGAAARDKLAAEFSGRARDFIAAALALALGRRLLLISLAHHGRAVHLWTTRVSTRFEATIPRASWRRGRRHARTISSSSRWRSGLRLVGIPRRHGVRGLVSSSVNRCWSHSACIFRRFRRTPARASRLLDIARLVPVLIAITRWISANTLTAVTGRARRRAKQAPRRRWLALVSIVLAPSVLAAISILSAWALFLSSIITVRASVVAGIPSISLVSRRRSASWRGRGGRSPVFWRLLFALFNNGK